MKPILKWQYEQVVKELLLLQGHGTDAECPCKTEGEMCVRKHLLTIQAYAEETNPMEDNPEYQEELKNLANEAKDLRSVEESNLCGHEVGYPIEISEWARTWRKKFEAHCLVCEIPNEKGGNPVKEDNPEKYDRCVADVTEKIKAGKLPEDSNPHAICTASLERHSASEDDIKEAIMKIAEKYEIQIDHEYGESEIEAVYFPSAGVLTHFKNETAEVLDKLKVQEYTVKTTYNPYHVTISWAVTFPFAR